MSVPSYQLSGLDNNNVGLNYDLSSNPLPDISNVSDPSGGANATSSLGSDLSSIGSDISSFLGSPLGNLALYGGAGALGASQAQSAAAQNQQLAGGISAIGAPAVGASNQLLSAYQGGKLTTPFQQQLNSALTFNQQQATSQQQGAAQALANSGGGQNIQSAQLGQNQQIAAQQSQLNTQASAQAFSGELSASEGLLQAGGPYVQQGILSEIQSNQQLQQQLQQLFSGLGNAYAQGQGAQQQSGQPNVGNSIGNLINQLEGGNTGALSSGIQGTVNSTLASDISGQGGYGLASDLGNQGFTDLQSTGSIIAPQVGDSLAADTGSALDYTSYFSGAGGQAAAGLGAAGTDLGTVGLPASVAADPSAAAAVSASGAGASALGTALPIAGAAIGGYETYNAIEQGNALNAGLSGAETGAAIGSIVPGLGTAIGAIAGGLIGAGGALIKGPHTMETISKAVPNSNAIKLQSGNSALLVGSSPNPSSGVAFGAGSSRAQGSGQWFLVPAASQKLGNGPTTQKGTPFYIGTQASQDLTNFANSVPLKNGQPDFSQQLAQYQQNPNAGTGLVGVFNNNGGAATWGMSYPQWLQAVWSSKNGVTGNLST